MAEEANTPSAYDLEKISDQELDELRLQLSDSQKHSEELLDQLMRCRAELDNLVKRFAREKEENAKYASERLVSRLLPVLDSLDQAAKHDEGARVLGQQLLDILKSEGLMPIEAAGKRFDPYLHEALFRVKCQDDEEDLVAEEILKGYTFHARVIRFAKVAVTKREC